VKVGAGGRVCVFSEAATDLIVDVAGYFGPTAAFIALRPGRVLDSRSPGGRTIDDLQAAIGARPTGSVTQVVVAGRAGVPADATAVGLNVTVVGAVASGYATVWPCGSTMPNASNVNYAAGPAVANSALVKVGADGKVCLFTEASADLIVDVTGYFTG
jgi:hypothetical protein